VEKKAEREDTEEGKGEERRRGGRERGGEIQCEGKERKRGREGMVTGTERQEEGERQKQGQ